jgi:hypothetical protein
MKARTNKELLEIKDLFEPIAPYFADAYNTLTSVVQSLALGTLGYVISQIFFEDHLPQSIGSITSKSLIITLIIIKLILAICAICVLWHRYITNNQFDAWKLDVFDALIPLLLGFFEILMILTIPKAIVYFASFFMCLSLLGIAAYWNAIRKHTPKRQKSLKVKELFQQHFGKKYGDIFYDEVTNFEKSAKSELIISTVTLGVVTTIFSLHLKFLSECIEEIFFSILIFAILVRLLYHDLWRHLENSERLKGFWSELENAPEQIDS